MTIARRLAPLLLLLGACAKREAALPRSVAPTDEEIWIIARAGETSGRTSTPHAPRMLAGTTPDATPLALERTDVQATVVGPFAALRVRQIYAGPERATEGAFVLPLPPAAVFHDLVVTLGRRHIRAIVRAREEAEAIYAAALRSGRVASLLREEDGVVLGMAHLPPRTPIHVEFSYAETMPWRDGAWELVVPRLPGGTVGARIDLDGLGAITTVESPTHAIRQTTDSGEQTSVVLREPATLRDADFVLRYAVDAHASPGAVVVSSGSRGTVAALILHPIAAGGRPTALHLAAIDWGTLVVEGLPASNAAVNVSVPEGRPLVLRARVLGGTPGTVRVTTLVAGRRRTRTFTAVAAPAEAVDLLPVLWASDAVRALWPDRDAMRDLALRYGVLSPVTALVAVDATAPSE